MKRGFIDKHTEILIIGIIMLAIITAIIATLALGIGVESILISEGMRYSSVEFLFMSIFGKTSGTFDGLVILVIFLWYIMLAYAFVHVAVITSLISLLILFIASKIERHNINKKIKLQQNDSKNIKNNTEQKGTLYNQGGNENEK